MLKDLLAVRQLDAWNKIVAFIKNPKKYGFSLKKPFALIIAVVELFGCVVFDTPTTPSGQKLDLSDYELVFCDEFEGDTLDLDAWSYRALGSRRFGYNGKSSVSVKDGNLYLTGEYLEDGEYGEGWYAGMICLNKLYRTGYYEIRCICNDDTDYWSAFWIQSTGNPYKASTSKGGTEAVELDIFESLSADYLLPSNRNAVNSTIHCAGVYDDSDKTNSCFLGAFKANNIYKEYNTYGMEWTEDEYIFYVNGVETARSSFGLGVCQNPEQVIVSLEIPDKMNKTDKSFKTDFIVDYVKIYEKK